MKKFFAISIAVFIALLGMSCTRIDSGYIGLKVNLLGSEKGQVEEVHPGKYWNLNPNIDYYKFPQFVQTYPWTEGNTEGSPNDEAIRFQTSEGLQITSDIGISFTINKDPGTAARLFVTYRRGVDEIIDGPLRNYVRDTFMRYGSTYTADQIIGDKKGELLNKVEADVKAKFAPDIVISSLSWLSSPKPPQSVIDALNAKVGATQLAMQAENEVRKATADADKKIAEARGKADSILIEAKAQAEANRLLSQSITPQLNQTKWIEKWDGKLPTVSGTDTIMDMRGFGK